MDEITIRQSFIFKIRIRMNTRKVVVTADNSAWRWAVIEKEELYE